MKANAYEVSKMAFVCTILQWISIRDFGLQLTCFLLFNFLLDLLSK